MVDDFRWSNFLYLCKTRVKTHTLLNFTNKRIVYEVLLVLSIGRSNNLLVYNDLMLEFFLGKLR